jgi:sulfur-oxidizing protein SoxY
MHRRDLVAALVTMLGALPLRVHAALSRADDYDVERVIREVLGERKVHRGRITLDVPALAGSGNSVPLTVRVESPMTAADHVQRVHVFATRNPRPHVMTVQLTPRSGRAEFSTRMRLSGTQPIRVFAEMSDRTVWMQEAQVDVTVGACDNLMFRF